VAFNRLGVDQSSAKEYQQATVNLATGAIQAVVRRRLAKPGV